MPTLPLHTLGTEVIQNLRGERQKWENLPRVIGKEGEDARMSGMFYTVVVQAVLLYRYDLWFVSSRIGKAL